MIPNIKRSLSSSPSPPLTPKKPKPTKSSITATTPKKSPSASSSWTNEKKSAFVKRLVETGYKSMDWRLLAEETQTTEEQCKNQLKPGRSNLRKTLLEMFK
ncbi:hypothetical protein I302_104198 [Kwoniella bestiolae CBS 10118]|uniref:Uncharacterized protein n=1 Tax=Kwoniella bestiolae CBS 10118 TaxID=1296100 RepID=A0A1B9GAK8_9TREE|nr:hypothetical protein I302_02907 [Kwoniella bestiolae CBS 10118]OCF28056.1 hypothetical protein I302_02907 [Kwoniella bestiolae CBS 10118]